MASTRRQPDFGPMAPRPPGRAGLNLGAEKLMKVLDTIFPPRYCWLMDQHAPPLPTPPVYTFPCPVCGEDRPVRETKAHKPYVRCDPCGVQLFVRGDEGIARFRKAVRTAEGLSAAEVVQQHIREPANPPRGRPPKPPELRERVGRAVEKVLVERPALGPLSVAGIRRPRE